MAEEPKRIVVVGGGLAGAKAVEALRAKGYSGVLTLVGEESELPYERPPLSKDYLQGKKGFDAAVVHDAEWYRAHDVDLRTGTAVMSIDRDKQSVTLAGGELLAYDRLLLATGAVPRKLDLPGNEAVKYLRTRHQSDALRESFGEGKHVVVIGAGWIGLETAAAAKAAGSDVTVVESAQLPLLAVLGKEMAEVFAQLHRDNGVDLRLDAHVEKISVDDDGNPKSVTVDGDELPADVVVAGIGVTPEDSLARSAGLTVDNGVVVNSSLRTSDPHIWAVGDVANHEHPLLGRRIRVEHWANALNQPAVAAASMLGDTASFDNLPYFFSDQFDLGMEYVGYAPADSYDRVVVRGDTGKREFVAFWLDEDNHVLAAMNVNVWDVVDATKALIIERREVDPDKLADPSVDLDRVAVGADEDDTDNETDNEGDTSEGDTKADENTDGDE